MLDLCLLGADRAFQKRFKAFHARKRLNGAHDVQVDHLRIDHPVKIRDKKRLSAARSKPAQNKGVVP